MEDIVFGVIELCWVMGVSWLFLYCKFKVIVNILVVNFIWVVKLYRVVLLLKDKSVNIFEVVY